MIKRMPDEEFQKLSGKGKNARRAPERSHWISQFGWIVVEPFRQGLLNAFVRASTVELIPTPSAS
jgi:hypothetical protein